MGGCQGTLPTQQKAKGFELWSCGEKYRMSTRNHYFYNLKVCLETKLKRKTEKKRTFGRKKTQAIRPRQRRNYEVDWVLMENGCVYRNIFYCLLCLFLFHSVFFYGLVFIFPLKSNLFTRMFDTWPVRPVFKSEWNISNFVLCVHIGAINTIIGTIRNHLLGLNNYILSHPFTWFCFHY